MSQTTRVPLAHRGIALSCPSVCDVCGKSRASRKINHDKCARVRQQRSKQA